MRTTRSGGPASAGALGLVIIVACLAAPIRGQTNTSKPLWSTVSMERVALQTIRTANGTELWAQAGNTIINGSQLAVLVTPTFQACASNCSATPPCNSFNWCDTGACPVNIQGDTVPENSCQLLYDEKLQQGAPVVEVASRSSQLGTAGVRFLLNTTPEVFAGYATFLSQGLRDEYDIPCPSLTNGTNASAVDPNGCVLFESPQAGIALCDNWAKCQAVTYKALGLGAYSQPYIMLNGDPSGAKVDPLRGGDLIPSAVLYVKQSQLGNGTSTDSGGSGWTVSAIAGTVVACVGVALFLGLGAWWAVRRRRHKRQIKEKFWASRREAAGSAGGGMGASGLSGGSGLSTSAPSTVEDIAAEWSRLEDEEGSAATQKLVAKMLAGAPNPTWADVIIPRSQIQFVLRGGRAVRLGGGSSGTVYQGLLNGASPCACKVFDFSAEASLPKYFIQEAALLRRLSHPGIVQFLGVSVTDGRGLLLMELVGGGDLGVALQKDGAREEGRQLGWYQRGRSILLQVAGGLSYLHSQNLVHLDLKPRNVLLTSEGAAKIADVGFSQMLHNDSHVSGVDGRYGTFSWCAPEVLLGGRANQKADIYSFGVLMWELCTGEQPVRGLMAPLEAPRHCPPEVAALHERCVSQDPAQRPTAAEIVQVLRSVPAAEDEEGGGNGESGAATSPPPSGAAGLSASNGSYGASAQHIGATTVETPANSGSNGVAALAGSGSRSGGRPEGAPENGSLPPGTAAQQQQQQQQPEQALAPRPPARKANPFALGRAPTAVGGIFGQQGGSGGAASGGGGPEAPA